MKRIISIALCIVMVFALCPSVATAVGDSMTDGGFALGSGDGTTPENAFLIANPEQLNNVRNYLGASHADKHFKLTADLDLNSAPYNSGSGWVPIGNYSNPFTGTFDGDGHTISSLYINNTTIPSYVGLFGYTGSDAKIRNLILTNADITGPDYVGTLAGWNNGLIENSSASGNVTGDFEVGGLIGQNEGSVANCFFTGGITSDWGYAGGLIGDNSGTVTDCHALADVDSSGDWVGGLVGGNFGPISDCYAAGTVSGGDYSGGLVGWNFSGNSGGITYDGSIADSFSTASVTATGWDTGGLVGSNDGTISGSYATGAVTSTDVCVGGLVGSNYRPILNSYAAGNVQGKDAVGGLVGYNDNAVSYCYSTGTVQGMAGRTDIGGLVGNTGGSVYDIVTSSFWDTESSGKPASVEGTGKTTLEMKQQATFTDWDFTAVWGINGTDNGGYPFLRWQGFVHQDSVAGVCRIGATGFATLDAALTTLADNTPATIVLLEDITDGDGISLSRKDVTIDLNGKNLTVNNNAGTGIDMNLRSRLNFTGSGNLTVRSSMAGLNLTQSVFTAAGSVLVDVESENNWGLSMDTECTVSFAGDVSGARGGIYASGGDNQIAVSGVVTSTGNYSENHAIRISQYNNTVQVGSAVVSAGTGAGVYVDTSSGATVTVGSSGAPGNVVGKGSGLWIRSGATVTVYGDIEGAVRGIYTVEDSTITVHGNVTSTAAAGEGQGVYCFANSTPATITINGNTEGISGAYVHGGGSILTINGNVTARGADPASNYGLYASYSEVVVSGNVTASQCLGVHSFENSEILVDGTVSAFNYLKTKYTAKTSADMDAASTRAGYLQYSDGNNAFVWINGSPVLAVPAAPQNFTATPGDGQVALSWTAPASDGGNAVTKYEVSNDNGINWTDAGLNTSHTFTGLTNGTAYTFKVRAVNSAGNGSETSVTATPAAPAPTQPGQLLTWGNNTDGQLGDGSLQRKIIPTHIGTDANWTKVSAGYQHTVAIKSDGSLWAWGNNDEGQLGEGSFQFKDSPVRIGSNYDWAAAETGYYHTVALKTNGSLWAWGYALGGYEYIGTEINWNVPTRIAADSTWIAVSAGSDHTVAIKADGSLWAWGWNSKGQLGRSDIDSYIDYSEGPVLISNDQWTAVSAGTKFTVALKADGSLWSWGWNNVGQLGDGTAVDKNVPTRVGSDTWLAVSTGNNHVIAIKTDGSLWAWGGNEYGELGNGSSDGVSDPPPHPVPTQIGTDNDWISLTAGYGHNAAFRADGSLWLWGHNGTGQLGDNTTISKLTPQRLDGAGSWLSIACGDAHTVATLEAGSTAPAAPQNFTATPGDGQVVLSWTAPASDGGAAISRYEVSFDNGITWVTAGTIISHTFTGLTNGTAYTLKVRAVNSAGNGPETSVTSTPAAAPAAVPETAYYNADVRADNGIVTTLPILVDENSGSASIDAFLQSVTLGDTVITIPSIPDVTTYSVGIPVPDLSTPEVQGTLSFNTDAGNITAPSNMLTGILGASGNRARITISQGDKSGLPADIREAVGERPLIQLTLSIDGNRIDWRNQEAMVTVSIPYTPTAAELANPESIVVWYIDGAGRAVSVPNGRYDSATGMLTFDTTHFSHYAVVYNKVSFNDVDISAWYSKAVSFIAAREITSGTGNGNYSPEAKLTRAEFIVMMLRACGIAPDENPTENFSDAGKTYYTGYLAAAKRLGVSAGVGNNLFAPEKEITRQEMFTLLYNALEVAGILPEDESGRALSDFSDEAEINSWARQAMGLLVETGIVQGYEGMLEPIKTTTRAEMAQVLYNLLST